MSDLIPEGTYRAKASSSTFGTTKNGNEVLEVNFEIVEGDQAGAIVRWSGYFSEKTEQRTRESLAYMGFAPTTQDAWVALCETYQDASAIFPQEVKIVVEHEHGEKQTFARVKWVNSLFGKGIKANDHPLDKASARSFAARQFIATRDQAPAAPAPRGNGPGGSTVGQRTSSVDARAQRGGARPAGSGVQEPPPGRFDDGGDDSIPF